MFLSGRHLLATLFDRLAECSKKDWFEKGVVIAATGTFRWLWLKCPIAILASLALPWFAPPEILSLKVVTSKGAGHFGSKRT